VLRASAPKGDFVLPPGDNPVVLVAAGVGITPFAPMLYTLAGGHRRVALVHCVRDDAHYPLREELTELAQTSPNIELHTCYSRATAGDYSTAGSQAFGGRVDATALQRLLPGLFDNADWLLCGPTGFMASISEGLEGLGVPISRIHQESFATHSVGEK
jgi:ferredoxin-NADP reductase